MFPFSTGGGGGGKWSGGKEGNQGEIVEVERREGRNKRAGEMVLFVNNGKSRCVRLGKSICLLFCQ